MTKIGIISDIHAEFWIPFDYCFQHIGRKIQQELADAELILLAGDIDNGGRSITTAKSLFPDKLVCLVAGNHEFYANNYHEALQQITDQAKSTNIQFLNRDVFIWNWNIRVLGATLWTDFALFGDVEWNMHEASRGLNDFRLIGYEGDALTPQNTLVMHNLDRDWLVQELDKPFDGQTIVLVHHAPVSFSVHENYVGDRFSPCFASKLEDVLVRDDIALVVWGHTHHSVDRMIGSTRFVSNQTGYAKGISRVETGNYGTIIEI